MDAAFLRSHDLSSDRACSSFEPAAAQIALELGVTARPRAGKDARG